MPRERDQINKDGATRRLGNYLKNMKCISCKNVDATIEVTKCATEQGGKSWTGEFCQDCTRNLWKEYGANPQINWIFEELKR